MLRALLMPFTAIEKTKQDPLLELQTEMVEIILPAIRRNLAKPYQESWAGDTIPVRVYTHSLEWRVGLWYDLAILRYQDFESISKMAEVELKLHFRKDQFKKAEIAMYVRDSADAAVTIARAKSHWLGRLSPTGRGAM